MIAQLKNLWTRWQHAVEVHLFQSDPPESIDTDCRVSTPKPPSSVADSAELLRLVDENFHLKREQEKLVEQLRFKDQAIAMLVHDLRNPLTAVSLAIETLESNLFPQKGESRLTPALTLQLFNQARTQARIIDQMITGLLEVGRGAADLHIQPHKLDLRKLCQEVIAHLSDRAQAKFQGIETDIPNDLPYVYADLERVRQVLINLLDNAIKYSPESSMIRISGFRRTTQKVQISVCDPGTGISEQNRDRIFEERFRLKHDLEGDEIGLPLCQLIIRAHYGQLWVESSPTRGACFQFTLLVYLNE